MPNTKPEIKTVMDVFKLLNKSNCRACNEKTCLSFAAACFQGKRNLSDCPYVDSSSIKYFNNNLNPYKTNEVDQDEVLKSLKDQAIKLNFKLVAEKVGGLFSDNKLTLKIFGKDFSIDNKGKIFSDIHINPWITIPFLIYLINCKGFPIKDAWVPFRELKKGKMWQGLFEMQCEKPLKKLAETYTDLMYDLIEIFNGKKVNNYSYADISMKLYPLPKVPMLICYFKPEDELASDLHLFFDSTADENCSIEGVYSLGVGLVKMFENLAMRHG